MVIRITGSANPRHAQAKHGTARHARATPRHATPRHAMHEPRHGTARHGTARHGTHEPSLATHEEGVASATCGKSSAHFSLRICATRTFDRNFKLVSLVTFLSFFTQHFFPGARPGCDRPFFRSYRRSEILVIFCAVFSYTRRIGSALAFPVLIGA